MEGYFVPVLWFPSLPSTNDYLKDEMRQRIRSGLVVAVKKQTRGRGRSGRTFVSPEGGIYFSFSLADDIPAPFVPALTLLAGLSVQRALFSLLGLETKIKWPNDILYQGKKLCGILAEGSVSAEGKLQYVIIGIGINNLGSSADFPEEFSANVCTLEELGLQADPKKLIHAILREFEEMYAKGNFFAHLDAITAEYAAHMAFLGEGVSIIRGEKELSGRLVGVSPTGEVLLETKEGILSAPSGELGLRPFASNIHRICAFSGNRQLSHSVPDIKAALATLVDDLLEESFYTFRAGGADGFDMLAALAVSEKKKSDKRIRLEVYLPYPNFRKNDPVQQQILAAADRIETVSPTYDRSCFARRNAALIEGADLLALYNTKSAGGSVQTAAMAMKSKIPVLSLLPADPLTKEPWQAESGGREQKEEEETLPLPFSQ